MAWTQRPIRCALASLSAVAVAGLALAAGGVRPAYAADDTPQYYLALGDSLSQGVQPNASPPLFETNRGYVDDLYAVERAQHPGLRLQKLGCPGETTTTMITGGVCPYAAGSQLNDAVAFLATHHVAFVTIDIGANNIDNCLTPGGIDPACVGGGFSAAVSDLPVIVATLRAAAPTVPIYGMNYYDPFLAAWLVGQQALARESVCITTGLGYGTYCGAPLPAAGFDGELDAIYAAFGVPVADVATAFQTNNFNTVPVVGLPGNVALVCTWTWACSPYQNFHANDAGYAVIAATFARTIAESR